MAEMIDGKYVKINETQKQKLILESMATSLRHGLPFSFNPVDMANLLDTIAQTMYPDDDTKLN